MNRISVILLYLLLFIPGFCYGQTQFRETVWLQLNRDIFLSGEDIEYTLSLLETDTYKASVLSKNVRLEFTDSEGNSILQKNIELTGSKASGSFAIPANLTSGWYILKSYTSWMRNFPGSEFTKHNIRILNPEDIEKDSLLYNNETFNIAVHPLDNPQNSSLLKCGIYTSNEYGDPVSTEGIVLSGPGDTVLTFHTNISGWATSYYRPSDPDRYQVFVPGYARENISIDIADQRSNDTKASFYERYGYISIDLTGLEADASYKTLVHRMYSWSWFNTTSAENGKLSIRIPVRDLPPGISQVSILDKNNKLIFKRLWSDYTEESAAIMVEERPSDDLRANNKIFECFSGGNFDSTGVNLLYVLADKNIESSIINNYLPGLPGWPANYIIPSDQDAFDAWINSNAYPNQVAEAFFAHNPESPETSIDINNIEYPPETRGGVLQGIVYNTDNNEPLESKYLALTILNDNSHFAASTDKNGEFIFTFPEHKGKNDYLINFIEEYEDGWQIEFKDEYDISKTVGKKRYFSFSTEELVFLRQQKLNRDIENLYYPHKTGILQQDSIPSKGSFYGTPDIRVRIDDYIQLPNLREVIYEVVPFVNIFRHKKKYEIKVTGDDIFSSKYPTLILVDGIPLHDYQDLLNLPPERIDYIDVVTTFYIHGNTIFEGIVNIKSVNNDFGGLLMPASTVLSTLSLPLITEYYPVETKNSEQLGMPSLNQILKWSTLKQSSNTRVGLSLNNVPGKYRISVYGFDIDGKWYRGELLFDNPASR